MMFDIKCLKCKSDNLIVQVEDDLMRFECKECKYVETFDRRKE